MLDKLKIAPSIFAFLVFRVIIEYLFNLKIYTMWVLCIKHWKLQLLIYWVFWFIHLPNCFTVLPYYPRTWSRSCSTFSSTSDTYGRVIVDFGLSSPFGLYTFEMLFSMMWIFCSFSCTLPNPCCLSTTFSHCDTNFVYIINCKCPELLDKTL